MTAARACPQCSSTETLYRKKLGDWLCGECDHAWADEAPGGADEIADAAPTGVAVFISYGHADANALVTRLKADLEASGCKPVWLDAEMIAGGDRWTARIEAGIRGSQALLAVMTAHALRETSICQDEVALAVAEGKRVVPVRIDVDPALRPSLLLVRRSWVDFSGDYEEALASLARALAGDDSALTRPLQSVAGQRPLAFDLEIAKLGKGFTGREWLLARLDAWLESDHGRAFVIEGEPGIGKSAIAARLASRADCAAVHFCSVRDADSLKPLAFIANLVLALSARLEGFAALVAARHPEEPRENEVTAFRQLVLEPVHALAVVPARPQLVVLDALDEAASREGESIVDLIAAQAAFLPPWLRLVATTRPEADIVARLAAFDPFSLDASSEDNLADVAAFISARLAEPGLARRIAGPRAAAHTLGELAAGNFLYAEQVLAALEAGTLAEADLDALPPALAGLYHEMLRRAWPDREAYRRDLAPILRCLTAAFAPVPWELLRAATGLDPETLNARLSALSSYLREDGSGRDARLSLYHRSFADWLASPDRGQLYAVDAAAGHELLAAALGAEPLSSEYAIRWLPRHLLALKRWEELAALLADLAFLDATWERDKHEVLRLWATLERESSLRMLDTYREAISSPEGRNGEFALARLLQDTGHLAAASALYEHRIEAHRDAGDLQGLQAELGYQAGILIQRGRLEEAMALHKEEERICRELGDPAGLQASLGNQALILKAWGDLEGAMALLNEEERLCREFDDPAGLAVALGNQGDILRAWGRLEEATALLKEQERICRELGDPIGLQRSLGIQALILRKWGRLEEAMALLKEQERICRELGKRPSLQRSLGNQALVLKAWGRLAEAMALLEEKERLCRELGDPAGLAAALGNQALILKAWGDLEGAMALCKEEERICRELADPAGLQQSLGNQGSILNACGKPEEAMALLKEQERICRELGDPAGLQRSLGIQALILRDWGELEQAMALYKEEERICRELGNPVGLGVGLRDQARCLLDGGRPAEALPLMEESVAIARELSIPALEGGDELLERIRKSLSP